MKIAVTYSSKAGLLAEYKKRFGPTVREEDIPQDFFAEGDSPRTLQAILDAFEEAGYQVSGAEADDSLSGILERDRPDLVFNIAEGLFGDFRESYVPIICERLGLPYTGSDALTLAICLNKWRAKEILSYYGIPNPEFQVYFPGQPMNFNRIQFPVIIKPVSEGSSKGIFNDSVVESPEEARLRIAGKIDRYHQPVLLEKYLPGAEFTAAVWGNDEDVEILPLVAIDYSQLPSGARHIYSYEAKWEWDSPDKPLDIFQCPANISPALQHRIEEVVLKAYRVLQIRDWCRIDIRLDENGVPQILELNPLPGILPDARDNSCFPKAARTAGYNYREMLNKVIGIAAKRNGLSI